MGRAALESFHEKADPRQEFFSALTVLSSIFSPFSQDASVATLPSALLCERFSLGASGVFSIQSFRAWRPRNFMKITRAKIPKAWRGEIEPTLAKSRL
jgi:hypothetical protein